MSPRPFLKMHGLGNDFVVFDAREVPIVLSAAQVRAISDRRTGVGCDQLIVVSAGMGPGRVAVQFWNCDGAEVGACGNGSRAVAALVGGHVEIETAAGVLAADADGGGATVDMGLPRFGWDAVPLAYAMDTARLPVGWQIPRPRSLRESPLPQAGGELAGPAACSVGNPHVTFFVADQAAVDLETMGPLIEQDPLFPEGVNVGVATMMGRDAMMLRVWERGAGLTRACGTGAVAAVANAQRRGLAGARVTVTLPGGDLVITRRDDGHLLMAGPAVVSFSGMIDLEDFT